MSDHHHDHDSDHSHHHHHGDHHPHDHARPEGSARKLTIVLALVVAFMVVEAVAGWLTNSLALLADAGHMLTDAGAIALGLFAAWLTRKPTTPQRTFGYHRAEILAALANAVTLIAIVVYICYEAWQRFMDVPQVMGLPMMIVAVVGLIVNLIGMRVLHGGHEDHSLNVQGVFWHIIGDALGSVGAIVAGVLMWWKGWYWADPLVSVVICAIILYGGLKLTMKSVNVLMESSPEHVDVAAIQTALSELPAVTEVHDLHVWTVTSGLESLSVHLTTDDYGKSAELLVCAQEILHDRFGLEHVTIQIEPPDHQHAECGFCTPSEHAGHVHAHL